MLEAEKQQFEEVVQDLRVEQEQIKRYEGPATLKAEGKSGSFQGKNETCSRISYA